MSKIDLFLLTEVQAKNISTSESIANFCLRPAQYLWNGKKIDFIQGSGSEKAVQLNFIYNDEDRSWTKTAGMILILIPSVIIGAVFKLYATLKHHHKEDDDFMAKCLNKNEVGKIYTPKGQTAFGQKISDFISVLRSSASWNNHLTEANVLFLSEVNHLRLLYENHHPSVTQGWQKGYSPEAKKFNDAILANIGFLWNLSYLNLVDRFSGMHLTEDVEVLKEINPTVISLRIGDYTFTDEMSAKEFFNKSFHNVKIL